MTRSMHVVTTIASVLGAALMATGAVAADITVIGSTAMTELVEAVIPIFEHDSGHKVKASFLSGSVLPVRVKEGAPADLIITTPESIDDLCAGLHLDGHGGSVEAHSTFAGEHIHTTVRASR